MPSKSDRICVVGAGPGGLSAAYFLVERGYANVTVLERGGQVGGKARTWWVDDTPIDLGALDVGKEYRRVRALAERFGLPLVKTARLGMMDLQTGRAASGMRALMARVGRVKLGWMVLKYLYFTGLRYADDLERPGLAGMPADLTAPMSVWLERHGLSQMTPIFDYACTNFGYGPVETIPAAYMLRFIDLGDFLEVLEVDLGLRSWPRNFARGYQGLWEAVAGQLPDVRLGVAIEGITRHPLASPAVRVRVAGQAEEEGFDHVIVACCLDERLPALVTDLSMPERELFSRVINQPYSTTVCRVSGLPRLALGTIPLTSQGRVYCLIKNWDDGGGCAVYMMNRDGLSHDALFDNLRRDLASIETLDGRPVAIRVEEILHHEDWTYFPHVSSDDMARGFFEEVEALQGRLRTYFTGGLLGFETVHNTMRYSEALVDRFFPA